MLEERFPSPRPRFVGLPASPPRKLLDATTASAKSRSGRISFADIDGAAVAAAADDEGGVKFFDGSAEVRNAC